MANISDGNMDNNHWSLFRGQRLFIFTVGCPVTFYCIKIILPFFQAHMYIKAQQISFHHVYIMNNQSTTFYFKNKLYNKQSIFLLNNSSWRILFIMWILKSLRSQVDKRRHLTFVSPTFEDKGRLQAHGNGVEIWLPLGQSLSRAQEQDCGLNRSKSGPHHS